MKFLREDFTSKFGVDFIQRIFSEIKLDRIDKTKVKVALAKLSSDWTLHVITLNKWLDGDTAARLFLTGKKLTSSDLASLGQRQEMKSTDTAKEYLLLFLHALRESGILSLLLCVDETEYVFSQMRGAKVASALNFLRDLYDMSASVEAANLGLKNIANIIFFFGISQSGWTSLTNLVKRDRSQAGPIEALMDRLQKPIELLALNRDETEELIRRRLSYSRTENRMVNQPLIPYTESFVDYIHKLTLGNPRKIVEDCDYALYDGLEQHVSKLTEEFAKKVLESHGILVEPVESGITNRPKTRKKKSA